MGCECASLRIEMKSEILSQRSLMVHWFETLMTELQDVKKQNSELKELLNASNLHKQESIAVNSEPSLLERYSSSGPLETNGESARQFLECQPELLQKISNQFVMSVEAAPELENDKLLAETGFLLTEDDQKIFPPEMEPAQENPKSPLGPESTNLERFESRVDTMETSSAFTNEDTPKRTKSKRQKSVRFVRDNAARRKGLNASKRNMTSTKKAGKFRCSKCPYETSYSFFLKKHSLTHTREKPFSCDVCDYKCKTNWSLVRHKYIHSRKKPFECSECHRSFTAKTSLERHKLSHTEEKPFECMICKQSFTEKGHFVRHTWIHTEKKPFSCEFCDYRCRNSTNLFKHNLTHTGEKPFECDQCEYRASQRSHLIVHRRTHTGEKPFACDLCDFRASHKCSVVYHKKRIHKLK